MTHDIAGFSRSDEVFSKISGYKVGRGGYRAEITIVQFSHINPNSNRISNFPISHPQAILQQIYHLGRALIPPPSKHDQGVALYIEAYPLDNTKKNHPPKLQPRHQFSVLMKYCNKG